MLWVLNMFYKPIAPLVNPVLRDKMHFNPCAAEDSLFTRLSLEIRARIINYLHESEAVSLLFTCRRAYREGKEKALGRSRGSNDEKADDEGEQRDKDTWEGEETLPHPAPPPEYYQRLFDPVFQAELALAAVTPILDDEDAEHPEGKM